MPVSVDPSIPVHPIDLDMYLGMSEAGLLEHIDVELVDGVLVERMTEDWDHVFGVGMAARYVTGGLLPYPEYFVCSNATMPADPISAPKPDVYVQETARFSAYTRGQRGLPPEGSLFIIEVSRTSLRWDMGRKRTLYAATHVPGYWVVDVVGERLIVHRDPQDGDYRTISIHGRGEPVTPQDLPLPPLDVAVLLDPPPPAAASD